jgi:glutathionylspermidine synthase
VAYAEFAERVQATRILSDPWLDGAPRLREQPVVLSHETWAEIARATEALGRAYDELARIVAREPALLDTFFHLTPCQKVLWLAQGPLWHGIARADVFLTAEGPRICELNSDTPSGEAEAVLLSQLARTPELLDPTAELEERFLAMIAGFLEARGIVGGRDAHPTARPRIGIVYPSEMPEDLSMIELYRGWLSRSFDVVLGSPFNLTRAPCGRAALLGEPCDLLVRHYKTDWWCERTPVFRDAAPFEDPEPLYGPLQALASAVLDGRTAVVNPLGAVLTQNKLTLAFFHEEIERFSDEAQATIRTLVPWTARLETFDQASLRARDDWVLKSDYGCEGAEVVLGGDVDQAEWEALVERAIPSRWVVQERFRPLTTSEGFSVNHGVYLVSGRAAGVYARLQATATDASALSAPVLVERGR